MGIFKDRANLEFHKIPKQNFTFRVIFFIIFTLDYAKTSDSTRTLIGFY